MQHIHCHVVQYAELAFTMYDQYYYYSIALLTVSLASGFTSTRVSYLKRLQLYRSVAQHRVVPVVQNGRVRQVSCLCSCHLGHMRAAWATLANSCSSKYMFSKVKVQCLLHMYLLYQLLQHVSVTCLSGLACP